MWERATKIIKMKKEMCGIIVTNIVTKMTNIAYPRCEPTYLDYILFVISNLENMEVGTEIAI